jgi:hypothetical protein
VAGGFVDLVEVDPKQLPNPAGTRAAAATPSAGTTAANLAEEFSVSGSEVDGITLAPAGDQTEVVNPTTTWTASSVGVSPASTSVATWASHSTRSSSGSAATKLIDATWSTIRPGSVG